VEIHPAKGVRGLLCEEWNREGQRKSDRAETAPRSEATHGIRYSRAGDGGDLYVKAEDITSALLTHRLSK
jgi:hypothetical protein